MATREQREGSRTRDAARDWLELPLDGFEGPASRDRGPAGAAADTGAGRERQRARELPAVTARRNAPSTRRPPPEPRPRPRRPPRPELERPPIQFERDRTPRGGIPRRQQILLPFIALIAMGAGAVAAIAITHEPQTRSLQQEVSSLQTQVASARQQLTTLQHVGASGSEVRRLSRTVAGLGRTVGGLQGSAAPLKNRVDALSICIPQLQGELAGQSIRGSGNRASLVSSATISPGCAAVLGAG